MFTFFLIFLFLSHFYFRYVHLTLLFYDIICIIKKKLNLYIFKSIVVKSKMEDSGSTDDQIRADFRGPGNAILKLAHKNFQATTVINSCHIDDLGKKEPFWLQGWPDLTPELRNYRVRGAIFDTVLDAYFRKPYFGLDGRTERALRDFECSLKKNGESTNFRSFYSRPSTDD